MFESDFDCLTAKSKRLLEKMRWFLVAVLASISRAKITGKVRKEKLEEITNGGTKMADISATQFKDLISDGLESKADYSVVVHYTALPERFGCKICEQFMKETGYVAKASFQRRRKSTSSPSTSEGFKCRKLSRLLEFKTSR